MTPFESTSARQFRGPRRMKLTERERDAGGFLTASRLGQAIVCVETAVQHCEPGGHCREVLTEAIEILRAVHDRIAAATAPKGGG